MAEILDYEEPQGEFDQIEETAPVEQKIEQEKQDDVAEIDDLPDFIRGKDLKALTKMAIDQKSMIDRQSAEVGEVRKLADELLKSQLRKQPEIEQPKEIDFFENPQEAIRQAVENNPKVLAAEQYNQQARMDSAKRMLVEKHPDFGNIIQEAEFANWVKSSPIRTQLYQMAEGYDVNAADELLSTYKQLKGVKQTQEASQTSKAEKDARDKTLRSASVDTGGSGETSKKVYRRADLIRLKMTDPQRYDALSDEITRAYQEGRVK